MVGNRNHKAPAPEVGETVILIPEPNNEFDRNAVAVYNSFMEQVGYVRQRGNTSEYVAKLLSGKPALGQICFKDMRNVNSPIILMDILSPLTKVN